jgi:hypothetical protein
MYIKYLLSLSEDLIGASSIKSLEKEAGKG